MSCLALHLELIQQAAVRPSASPAPVLLGMQPAVSSDDTLPVLDGPHRRPKASKDSNKLSRGTSVGS